MAIEARLRVRRYDPESGGEPYYQEYETSVPEWGTVLDALIQIREAQDGTLTLRCSCRSAICGSCAMKVNGESALACKTKLVDIAPDGETVTVEPMGNQPIVRDLVVDMQPFWDKVNAVQPYLQPDGPPESGREYLAPNDAMQHLSGVMNCIMCGACVSECTVLEVDDKFLGPAALAKAYRFAADPRDDKTQERLVDLFDMDGGMWDCTHCFECVQVCPKGVEPMERIVKLREMAMDAGLKDHNGVRHSKAFSDSVEHSGWLDESQLAVKSFKLTSVKDQVGNMPVALRMLMAGKMPNPIHRPISSVREVRRVFDETEQQHQQQIAESTSQKEA